MTSAAIPGRSAALLFVRLVIVRDWKSLAVTLASCAVAAVVASFQYSVYTSFVRTGAIAPHFLGGDFWVTAASVECFDFPDPISEDQAAAIARFVPDARFRRVVFGFATWRSPTGQRGNVAVIGVDDAPVPDDGFLADRSDLARLDLARPGPSGDSQASIADTTLHLAGTVDRLPTFLGAPYVVVGFERGRELLRMDPTRTAFLIGDLATGRRVDFARLRTDAAAQFPELTVVSAPGFEASSSTYWQRKTGAGLAILLAAVLAGLLMAILMANGVMRFVQRYHHDLVSLIGIGASRRDIALIVGGVAAAIALVTMVIALAATPLIIRIMTPLLPWVSFVPGDAAVPLGAVAAALLIAMIAARRAVSAYGPEVVFRT